MLLWGRCAQREGMQPVEWLCAACLLLKHRLPALCTAAATLQVRLYALRNGTGLSTKAVANYTRSELATALRKVGRGGAAGLWKPTDVAAATAAAGTRCLVAMLPGPSPAFIAPALNAPLHPTPHRAPQSPYHTNLLMAGWDEGSGPALYWCDYLATLHKMNICGNGYGQSGRDGWSLARSLCVAGCWLAASASTPRCGRRRCSS